LAQELIADAAAGPQRLMTRRAQTADDVYSELPGGGRIDVYHFH
jgi:hypothetical protein